MFEYYGDIHVYCPGVGAYGVGSEIVLLLCFSVFLVSLVGRLYKSHP